MTSARNNYLFGILTSLCSEIDAKIVVDPAFKRAGYIEFLNGKRAFFKGTSFDINGQGSSQIARDKDYSAYFLAMEGLQVPQGVLCFSPRFIEKIRRKNADVARALASFSVAIEFAEKHSYPVIVKPNEGAEGDGVRRITDVDGLCLHLGRLFEEHERVLVQRQYDGLDHRIVVLDGEVISAYRRTPLSIVGDGVSTVAEQMHTVADNLRRSGVTPSLVFDQVSISDFLTTSGRSLDNVPEAGDVWPLLPNANLSMGGRVDDMTDCVCQEFGDIATRAASALGLRYAGVDILCSGLDAFDPSYVVLEVNSAPGLNNFGRSGERENDEVVGLYRRLLAALEAR